MSISSNLSCNLNPFVISINSTPLHVVLCHIKWLTLQRPQLHSDPSRGVIRFLKNRIYPVFRAKLFRKSDLMLKKCRFALREHENHPFLAIFAIFGNSVLSQPTIRHIPRPKHQTNAVFEGPSNLSPMCWTSCRSSWGKLYCRLLLIRVFL